MDTTQLINRIDLNLPLLLRRQDRPSFQEWKTLINHTLSYLERDSFQKVVLARQTTLTFASGINPLEVLKLFHQVKGENTLYLIQLDESTAFVGATPEKLFTRTGKEITTEVVAGTKMEEETWGEKEKGEADWVQQFIDEKLPFYCSNIRHGKWKEKRFGHLRHLHCITQASLKEGVQDLQLMELLHPTPALGGYPQTEALAYISSVEPFDRGWYGGVFGTRSSDEANLAVTIRCALILGSEMHLFSGAGIVKGSKAEAEWEELDRKLTPLMRHL